MKKGNNILVAIAALCFVWGALGVSEAARDDHEFVKLEKKKGNCSYTVIIETTCRKDAGTSDHISLRFGDAKGNDVLIRHLKTKHARRVDYITTSELDDVPREAFRACGVDQFRVSGAPCMDSPICYMFLKQIGHDSWRPGVAQVLVHHHEDVITADHVQDQASESFYFRRYLPQHVWHGSDMCDTTVTPFGIKYTRKVFPTKHV